MNPQIKRILGESVETPPSKDTPAQVIEDTRPVPFHRCPHCQQEIYEKHTYIDGDFMSGNYIERHSDCGGAIKWPPPDPKEAEYVKKHWGIDL